MSESASFSPEAAQSPAEVISLLESKNPEDYDPDELDDPEKIKVFLNLFRDPTHTLHDPLRAAETVDRYIGEGYSDALSERALQWRQALAELKVDIMDLPEDELEAHAQKDQVYRLMEQRIMETKASGGELIKQRRALLNLMELRVGAKKRNIVGNPHAWMRTMGLLLPNRAD